MKIPSVCFSVSYADDSTHAFSVSAKDETGNHETHKIHEIFRLFRAFRGFNKGQFLSSDERRRRCIATWLLAALLAASSNRVASQCNAPVLRPLPDMSYLLAGEGPKTKSPSFRWYQNGNLFREGRAAQRFLLHGDPPMRDAFGIAPVEARNVELHAGRWGQSFLVKANGRLSFNIDGALDLQEGSAELWIALRENGSHAVYAAQDHILFRYRAANGDELSIRQSRNGGVLYGGGTVRGQWQSAYGASASMSAWAAAEWHHLVFTWSAVGNFMRFYVDGVLTADTNERHYWPPEASGTVFTLGAEYYLIDECVIYNAALPVEEIRAHASRPWATMLNETWLPLASMLPGTRLALEYEGCTRVEYLFRGIPILDVDPSSTLLPPGATSLRIRFNTRDPASCSWALGHHPTNSTPAISREETQSLVHEILIAGMDPRPDKVNELFLTCDSEPDYILHLRYRSLPQVNPHFPRKGNLWGTSQIMKHGMDYAAKIDLHLGASFTAAQIQQLRQLNPNALILTSINTVENSGVPDNYYLKDVQGKRIEVWPGTFRLNLTKKEVAEYQARYAYQRMLDSNLMVDGCFFDNFFTSQSWLRKDMWGKPVQLDANEDGKEDDPQWLDQAWKEGVYYELNEWRKLMPYALASGHLPRPPAEEFSGIFNGDSIGFLTADVIEGKQPFSRLWSAYFDWWKVRKPPVITMVESSPPDDIAYGYSYSPSRVVPSETLEFARTYFPNVRFGLAFTLLGDGFFAHEYGDTWHGNDWWYDELDFDLGFPKGEAGLIELNKASVTNQMRNGGFENPLEGTWQLGINTSSGAVASVSRDASTYAEGRYSVRIDIAQAGQGVNWHIDFNQRDQTLTAGVNYDFSFWAKAAKPHPISLSSQKGSPDWRNYGLSATVQADTTWKRYQVTFQAKETVNDSRIQFFLGTQIGTVWIDDVSLVERPLDIWQREFDNGLAILNATSRQVTVPVHAGFRRLQGTQAPKYEYILDNDSTAFSAHSNANVATLDSGEWTAVGPFYHDWGKDCRRNDSNQGSAQWDLRIPAADEYTLSVWWADAPLNRDASRDVLFEVVSGNKVLAAKLLDQSQPGDRWLDIAALRLAPQDQAVVRVTNRGTGHALADAVYVRSASRYNDGSAVQSVILQPYDGIILQREGLPAKKNQRRK